MKWIAVLIQGFRDDNESCIGRYAFIGDQQKSLSLMCSYAGISRSKPIRDLLESYLGAQAVPWISQIDSLSTFDLTQEAREVRKEVENVAS
jgi:hypothetical protein